MTPVEGAPVPSRTCNSKGTDMYDLLYLVIIVVFFGLMLAFVHGLAVLGRDAAIDERETP